MTTGRINQVAIFPTKPLRKATSDTQHTQRTEVRSCEAHTKTPFKMERGQMCNVHIHGSHNRHNRARIQWKRNMYFVSPNHQEKMARTFTKRCACETMTPAPTNRACARRNSKYRDCTSEVSSWKGQRSGTQSNTKPRMKEHTHNTSVSIVLHANDALPADQNFHTASQPMTATTNAISKRVHAPSRPCRVHLLENASVGIRIAYQYKPSTLAPTTRPSKEEKARDGTLPHTCCNT